MPFNDKRKNGEEEEDGKREKERDSTDGSLRKEVIHAWFICAMDAMFASID